MTACPELEDVTQKYCDELMPLVKRLARGLARVYRLAEFQDLFQDGCVGMVRAVRKFDPSRGVPLEAYARPIIAGAILNGIRSRDPLSKHVRKLLHDAERDCEEMQRDGHGAPTLRELSTRISGLGAAMLLAHRASTLSLDVPLPAGTRAPRDESADPASIAETRERAAEVRKAIGWLTERERAVVELTYYGDQTGQAVSQKLNVSAQRVSQLRQSAFNKMRNALVAAQCR